MTGNELVVGGMADVTMLGKQYGCADFSAVKPFKPGNTEELAVGWAATPSLLTPLAAGPATVRATFRSAVDERGQEPAVTVTAEAEFDIVGQQAPTPGLTLGNYVDAALGDERFYDWVTAGTVEGWINPNWVFWSPETSYPHIPPYDQLHGLPVIEVGLFRDDEAAGAFGYRAAIIDQRTGEVVAFRDQ
jgi:hypothetical protein